MGGGDCPPPLLYQMCNIDMNVLQAAAVYSLGGGNRSVTQLSEGRSEHAAAATNDAAMEAPPNPSVTCGGERSL